MPYPESSSYPYPDPDIGPTYFEDKPVIASLIERTAVAQANGQSIADQVYDEFRNRLIWNQLHPTQAAIERMLSYTAVPPNLHTALKLYLGLAAVARPSLLEQPPHFDYEDLRLQLLTIEELHKRGLMTMEKPHPHQLTFDQVSTVARHAWDKVETTPINRTALDYLLLKYKINYHTHKQTSRLIKSLAKRT